MRQIIRTLAVLFVIVGPMMVLRSYAADPVKDARIQMGKVWYDKYCTSCHGAGGAPGSAVYVANKKPIDLRTYVERNGGKFPSGRWLNAVFNPRPGGVHTDVWERIRSDQGENIDRDAIARGVVANIAEYVVSIQNKNK